MDGRHVRPDDEELLSEEEHRRVARLLRPADRALRTAGIVLIRRVVGEEFGMDPRDVQIDRTCPQCSDSHGRPTLPNLDVHASITHAGHIAGLSLCRAGLVGLDIEQPARCAVRGLSRQTLGPGEGATTAAELCRYWTRKEALVKATGDGIGVGLCDVLVTGPYDAPRLVSYPRRPDMRAMLLDLDVGDGYLASVAILTAEPVGVDACWYPMADRSLTTVCR